MGGRAPVPVDASVLAGMIGTPRNDQSRVMTTGSCDASKGGLADLVAHLIGQVASY